MGEGVYSYEDSLDEASLKEMRQLSSKAKYGKKLGTRVRTKQILKYHYRMKVGCKANCTVTKRSSSFC